MFTLFKFATQEIARSIVLEKYLVVWPKSDSVVHINYHYSDFGEIVDYLNNKFPEKVIALDQDISNENVIDFIKKNRVSRVAMMVNFENVENAFGIADEIKTWHSCYGLW